jgi:thiosulfate dehydrogenase
MRNLVFGFILAILIIVLGGLAFLSFGLMHTNADAHPSRLERRIAMNAMDASMERHAPQISNPIPPTDENLIQGMKIYTMNCAVCHGTLDEKPSLLEKSLYPPPPQLILEPLDDPEWHTFYAVRTGVRYTGMPAWNQVLSTDDMWKVTAFISHIEKLPPAVQDYWKKAYGVAPQPAAGMDHEHMH